MQKLFLLLVIPLLVLTTTIVFAKAEKSEKAENHGHNSIQPEPTKTCDPNANWKNHGEYVSCVAKLHQGGSTVSAAARSDVGKKHSTPSATPAATPSPEATESALSSSQISTEIVQQAGALVDLLENFLTKLKHLFSF